MNGLHQYKYMFALSNCFERLFNNLTLMTTLLKLQNMCLSVSSALSFWKHCLRRCQTVTCEPCRQDLTSFLLPETSQSIIYILANKHTWIIHSVLLHIMMTLACISAADYTVQISSGATVHQRRMGLLHYLLYCTYFSD